MISGLVAAGFLRRTIQRIAVCAAAVAALAMLCQAQRGQGQQSSTSGNSTPQAPIAASNPFGDPDAPDPFGMSNPRPGVLMVPADSARMVDAEACNSWTESGVHSPTVSVNRLQVPDKASGEFQKACSAYKDKRYVQAEDHARKAIEIYPDYAASWVLLGQVLDAEHNRAEAVKACSQGSTLDPHYIAPYLCLAEFAARDEDWEQVSRLSDEALTIDPVGNAYALYYSADANFHLKHLSDAETDARAALPLDPWHHLPQLHLILAHIYDAKGDPRSSASELKEFLKQAPSSPDAPAARASLKQLEAKPAQDGPTAADKSSQGTDAKD